MDIRILGALEVVVDDEPLPLAARREGALLTLLALQPGETVAADRLIDALWGEDLPNKPGNALQALVSRLRKSIGPEAILTRVPGYALAVPPDAVDAVRFRALVDKAGAASDPATRKGLYGDALGLWRGPALVDFEYEEFAQREAAALTELRLLATEGRIVADLDLGAGAELIPELEELIAAHPLRESLRASQMLALYRAGRQADALRAYSAARRVLGEELGIEPGPELRALEERILMQDPALAPAATNLPAEPRLPARLASFIGREREMAEVAAAIKTSRLVTLTGAGGAGKTSLAIEVARSVEDEYTDGVWLVELAPLTNQSQVPDALVAALGLEQVVGLGAAGPEIPTVATAVEYLRKRQALLLIDNCEHVIDTVASSVETILLACPEVDVLATSRDRIGIPGELLWRVPSLGLDNGADAVRLFVERAQAVNAGFRPDGAALAVVADICRKVDGMPLAIELAAARVRSLAVDEIAERLESGIGVLSAGTRRATERQQTLRRAIDWSYELLRPKEADLLARLSVFHGGFTLDSAAAVAPDWPDVLEPLERLIDSSLLAPLSGGRYRMLETIRSYAADKLAEAGETDGVMDRLLDHFMEKMASAEHDLRGPDQLARLEQIEADHDTMRGVLAWGREQAAARALRLAGRLGWFWYLRGSVGEARSWFESLLAAAGPTADPAARGDGLFFASLCNPRPELAREGFVQARDAYRQVGETAGEAHALAMIAAWGTDRDETRRLSGEAAEICASTGYEWGMALIRFLQAGGAAVANDMAESARLAEDAVARFTEVGDRWGQGYGWYTLGVAQRARGDYAAAEEAFRAALEHARPMRLRREMAPVMAELASIATMRGDYAAAEQWLDEARRYADEVPFAGSQGMVRNALGRLARVRGDLDAAVRYHEEAVALYADGSTPGGLAYSFSCAGFAEAARRDLEAAKMHHRRALEVAVTTGDVFAVALALEGIGAVLIAAGRPAAGVELVAAGLAMRERAGTPLPAGERTDTDTAMESAAQQLTHDEYQKAIDRGGKLDLDSAVVRANGALD